MSIEKMKKISGTITMFFLLSLICLPIFTYGAEAPIPADSKGTGITYECGAPGPNGTIIYGNCDFNDLVAATKKVVNFGVIFTLEFSVIIIAWAGFKYMISGDKPKERTEANEMLRKVAFGIVFILAAWLIVTLITNALLKPEVLRTVPLGT